MRLLLASGSATRRRMLEQAGVDFEIALPNADEEAAKRVLLSEGATAVEIAARLALLKASSVSAADALVIGSDQVLELDDGSLLSKPRSRDEAGEQLRALSGRRHRLHSAAVLVEKADQVWGKTETVELNMRMLSDTFIRTYLDEEYEVVRHNVGCYRIEGRGAQLFDSVNGSHFAVLGLPLLPLLAELRRREMLAS